MQGTAASLLFLFIAFAVNFALLATAGCCSDHRVPTNIASLFTRLGAPPVDAALNGYGITRSYFC